MITLAIQLPSQPHSTAIPLRPARPEVPTASSISQLRSACQRLCLNSLELSRQGITSLGGRDRMPRPSFPADPERIYPVSRGCLFCGAESLPASEQFVACVSGRFGWIFLHPQPGSKVECIHANAQHIRRDKAVLRRVQCDHTDHETV